jgi:hypothetical protein
MRRRTSSRSSPFIWDIRNRGTRMFDRFNLLNIERKMKRFLISEDGLGLIPISAGTGFVLPENPLSRRQMEIRGRRGEFGTGTRV